MNKLKFMIVAAATGALAVTGVVLGGLHKFSNVTLANEVVNKTPAGSNTDYTAFLACRVEYDGQEKYFTYNIEKHYSELSEQPGEYLKVTWDNGNANQFTISSGSKYLDISTTSNVFAESDTPVYWGRSPKGIGRTLNGTTKYLYYNHSATRLAPYTDKTKNDGTLTTGYATAYLYTPTQLEAWQQRCTGTFAEACLNTLLNGNFIPSSGEAPTPSSSDSDIPSGAIVIRPSDGTAATSADFTFTKDDITVSVTASTLTGDQIRVFKNQTITISAESLSKIEFTCTTSGDAKYGPGCFAAQAGYSYTGNKGTWTGSAPSVTFTASTNQVRITQIVVTK